MTVCLGLFRYFIWKVDMYVYVIVIQYVDVPWIQTELSLHRERDFVFLFQATNRHAGLATIHCRNDSANSTDVTLHIKLIVKPTSELQALPSRDLSVTAYINMLYLSIHV